VLSVRLPHGGPDVLSKAFFWMSASLVVLVTLSVSLPVAANRFWQQGRLCYFCIYANGLKPTECTALNLTRVVVLANGMFGYSAELIIGTPQIYDLGGGASIVFWAAVTTHCLG